MISDTLLILFIESSKWSAIWHSPMQKKPPKQTKKPPNKNLILSKDISQGQAETVVSMSLCKEY